MKAGLNGINSAFKSLSVRNGNLGYKYAIKKLKKMSDEELAVLRT